MTAIHCPFFLSISFQKETIAMAMLDFYASYKREKVINLFYSNFKQQMVNYFRGLPFWEFDALPLRIKWGKWIGVQVKV